MARRSPLLLLLSLPALALVALYWLDEEPRAPESAASVAIPAPVPEAPVVALAAAGEPQKSPGQAVDTAADRRVRVAARIEGRITYSGGALPGGKALVYAGLPDATWRWERAGRRIHAGLNADTVIHAFADADGRFVLEWSGDRTELAVAAMAPTAATETTVRWRAVDKEPLALTLEPRAALFVDVRPGAGFPEGAAPNFHRVGLRLSTKTTNRGDLANILATSRSEPIAWADAAGRAHFWAVPPGQDLEIAYEGNQAVATVSSVSSLASGEQRSVTIQLDAGAHLLGRVVDESGAPVATAYVRARGPNTDGTRGRVVSSARTDHRGRFELPHVSPAIASLEFQKTGYMRGQHDIGAPLAHGSRRDFGDLVLENGARIAGQVRHADGRPAAGAAVWAEMNLESQQHKGTPSQWSSDANTATSDNEGHFQLRGLAKGVRYDLTARLDADGRRERARELDVRDGQKDLVLVLAAAPFLVGRVLKPNGDPLVGARVRAKRNDHSGRDRTDALFPIIAQTDAEGNFRLEMEEPGTFSIRTDAEGFAPSRNVSVEVPSDVPLELELRRSLTVAGRVVDTAGQPVPGATVSKARGFEDPWSELGYTEEHISARIHSDADGHFEMSGLPPGDFVLQAAHPDYASGAEVVVELQEDQRAPDVVLTLQRGAIVRGVLYEMGERAGAGVRVTASPGPSGIGNTVSTDAVGEFVFERLHPGRWQFFSMGSAKLPDEPTEQNLAAMLQNVRVQVLELEDGLEYAVELGAPPAYPVHLRGKVLRAGEPLSKGLVVFLPLRNRDAGMRIASLDQAGRYDVVLPEPGGYAVTASDGDIDVAGNPGTSLELHCEIPATPNHSLDFHLPGGAIRGEVRGPDGQALARILVTCSREDGLAVGTMRGGTYGSTRTDGDGRYELTLLAREATGSPSAANGSPEWAMSPPPPPEAYTRVCTWQGTRCAKVSTSNWWLRAKCTARSRTGTAHLSREPRSSLATHPGSRSKPWAPHKVHRPATSAGADSRLGSTPSTLEPAVWSARKARGFPCKVAKWPRSIWLCLRAPT